MLWGSSAPPFREHRDNLASRCAYGVNLPDKLHQVEWYDARTLSVPVFSCINIANYVLFANPLSAGCWKIARASMFGCTILASNLAVQLVTAVAAPAAKTFVTYASPARQYRSYERSSVLASLGRALLTASEMHTSSNYIQSSRWRFPSAAEHDVSCALQDKFCWLA